MSLQPLHDAVLAAVTADPSLVHGGNRTNQARERIAAVLGMRPGRPVAHWEVGHITSSLRHLATQRLLPARIVGTNTRERAAPPRRAQQAARRPGAIARFNAHRDGFRDGTAEVRALALEIRKEEDACRLAEAATAAAAAGIVAPQWLRLKYWKDEWAKKSAGIYPSAWMACGYCGACSHAGATNWTVVTHDGPPPAADNNMVMYDRMRASPDDPFKTYCCP